MTNLVPLSVVNKLAKLRTPEVDHIEYATSKNKKYKAVLKDGRRISFGAPKYSDFLIHKDPMRRKLYRLRHQHDMISKPSPGRYSWHLLW